MSINTVSVCFHETKETISLVNPPEDSGSSDEDDDDASVLDPSTHETDDLIKPLDDDLQDYLNQ